jgi:Flp pilus assembly protein TadB
VNERLAYVSFGMQIYSMDELDEWEILRLQREEREYREHLQRIREQEEERAREQLRKELETVPERLKSIEEQFVPRFHDLYFHLFVVHCLLFVLVCVIVWLIFR